MIKTRFTIYMVGLALSSLALSNLGIAQTSAAKQSAPSRLYRLTFVLSYPEGKQPSQSLVLDVPVSEERSGMSGMNLAAGLTGKVDGSVLENLQCADVKRSSTGLAARVTFAMDSVTMEPALSPNEPIHHQLNFERKIDVVLGKPTRITEEMQRKPLRQGDEALVSPPPPAPQITVTAVEL